MSNPVTTPWDDHYMLPAFISCVHWAIGEEEIIERFRKETGCNWKPGKTPLERMIDESTGIDRDFIQKFVNWVADEIFGKPEDVEAHE